MGKWAQKRKRGGCGKRFSQFPLDPPAPEDWVFTNDGFTEAIAFLVSGTCPVGANGILLSDLLNPAIPPGAPGTETASECDAPAVDGSWFSEAVLNGVLCYTLDDVRVSDWSAVKQTTIP